VGKMGVVEYWIDGEKGDRETGGLGDGETRERGNGGRNCMIE